ncbi:WhiB family transcriptional regulator [Brevibacterium sediminis]
MTDYIRGSTRPHKPPEDQGISLAGFGIPTASMNTWMTLQGWFAAGEVPPCAGRHEWTSSSTKDKRLAIRLCADCPAKHACREFAETNNERYGIWGGQDRSTR